MSPRQLTELVVRNASPPESGQYVIWDKSLPGFGLRVSQGGTRSYVVMFYEGPRKRRVTIGKYPALGLGEARAEAKRILAGVMLGTAPEMPSMAAPVLHFTAALDAFVETHCRRNNREATARETERLLRRHFEPKFGRMALGDITPQKISGLIDQLLHTPGEANHAFSAIRKFFNWARERHHVDRSPCEGMRLPTKPRVRERVLEYEEIAKIFAAATADPYPYGAIVQLLLLTAQRRQEIVGLRWSDVDLDANVISIPAERNKSGRAHTVPIGAIARQILENLPRLGDLVFPARGRSETSFSGFSKAKRTFDVACGVTDWTLHDLRRTAATNMAGLGVPPHVVERILNHSTGTISGVAAIYNRFQYMDEMREALKMWEAQVREIAGTVVDPIGDEAGL